MRGLAIVAFAALGLALGFNVAGTTGAAASGPCGTKAAPAQITHVVWIWMENHSYSSMIGKSDVPYINSVAGQCGLATNYSGVVHPSLPNYIAATSGSTQGIADDNPPAAHRLSVPSIYSQVKSAGQQWRDYEESAPGNCPSSGSGLYAVKHDPAPYYTGIAADCANWDVPMGTTGGGAFLSDLNAGNLPAFSLVTPNLCNDMHDCSISTGDTWLQSWIPKITSSPNYQAANTAIFITWDEDDGSSGNHVPMIVISPYTPAGSTSGTALNHYSLLKSTEQLLGLSGFLGSAGGANSMVTPFFSGAQPPPTTSTTSTMSTTTQTTTTPTTTTPTNPGTTTTTPPPPTTSTTPTTTTTTSTTTTTTTTTPPQPAFVLPIRSLTPGAYDRRVREATIGRTICLPGWTRRIRPSVR
jgi:phosphatidylinositol-3-phosphatase